MIRAAFHIYAYNVGRMTVLSRHVGRENLELRERVDVWLHIGAALLVLRNVRAVHQPAIPDESRSVDLYVHHRGSQGGPAGDGTLAAGRVTGSRHQGNQLPE